MTKISGTTGNIDIDLDNIDIDLDNIDIDSSYESRKL